MRSSISDVHTPPPPPPRLARVDEAVTYADRSRRWLFLRLQAHQLTRYRSGHDARVTLIDLDELDDLLKVRPVRD